MPLESALCGSRRVIYLASSSTLASPQLIIVLPELSLFLLTLSSILWGVSFYLIISKALVCVSGCTPYPPNIYIYTYFLIVSVSTILKGFAAFQSLFNAFWISFLFWMSALYSQHNIKLLSVFLAVFTNFANCMYALTLRIHEYLYIFERHVTYIRH